jgi:hypothetical protein
LILGKTQSGVFITPDSTFCQNSHEIFREILVDFFGHQLGIFILKIAASSISDHLRTESDQFRVKLSSIFLGCTIGGQFLNTMTNQCQCKMNYQIVNGQCSCDTGFGGQFSCLDRDCLPASRPSPFMRPVMNNPSYYQNNATAVEEWVHNCAMTYGFGESELVEHSMLLHLIIVDMGLKLKIVPDS